MEWMIRKLSNEEKAARAVARRAALARRKTSRADAEAATVAAQRFNARSTRASLRRSVLTDATLTIEEYRMAVARDLVGSGLTNESLDALPIAYDGPHQVRWDATSWQGFTRMSSSRRINNATDTDPSGTTTTTNGRTRTSMTRWSLKRRSSTDGRTMPTGRVQPMSTE